MMHANNVIVFVAKHSWRPVSFGDAPHVVISSAEVDASMVDPCAVH